jgi:hypothetical protein
MPPKFSTYFSFSEFNGGTRASFDQFRAELSQFNGPAVVYVCGVMNSVVTDWQGHYRAEAHEELVRNSFAPQFAERIIAEGRNPENHRGVYHRRQLLFVSKQAILMCPETGGKDPRIPPYGGEMGRVLLMANDLLPKGLTHSGPTLLTPDQMINVMSEFIPIGEASGTFKAINKIVRSRLMVDRFFPKAGTEIRRTFEETTGVTLDEYFALCLATLCRYSDLDFKKYQADPGSFVLSEGWYRTTPVSPAVLASFLAEISATREDFAQSLSQRKDAASDFTCFRSKPIFRENQDHFLIDSLYLAEKGESGVFWSINEALPKTARLRFHQDWGLAFEAYVNWLIAESADELLNHIYPNPEFCDTGEEVSDALIVCGDSLLFVESKGATFTADAKYGTDPAKLRDEIETKLVQNRESGKGIGQLAARIAEVFDRKRPRAIQGLDTSKINKVFPVLVTRDDIGAALVINAYLVSRFRDLFNRKSVSVTVTPPHVLSAQDLEMLCGYFREASFADLLDERYRNDRGMLSSFWLVDNAIIDRIGERECKPFADATHAHFQTVAKTLFPCGEAGG